MISYLLDFRNMVGRISSSKPNFLRPFIIWAGWQCIVTWKQNGIRFSGCEWRQSCFILTLLNRLSYNQICQIYQRCWVILTCEPIKAGKHVKVVMILVQVYVLCLITTSFHTELCGASDWILFPLLYQCSVLGYFDAKWDNYQRMPHYDIFVL